MKLKNILALTGAVYLLLSAIWLVTATRSFVQETRKANAEIGALVEYLTQRTAPHMPTVQQ